MTITDEQYRSIGVDPREYKVPDWYKEKLHAEGWKPCPDDEECGHCGRLLQYGGELCCGHHLEENKLIARDDDDSLYYPIPTRMDYLERVEFLDGVITGAAEGFDSLEGVCAFDSRDWSVNKRDAWLYGIVCGWDGGQDEDPPEDAMAEMVEQHGWNAEAVERLRRMQQAVTTVMKLGKEKKQDGQEAE
jgi:hypothetical protein